MQRALLVFLGGGTGAGIRALLLEAPVPWHPAVLVLLINLAGSFAIGVVFALADEAGLLGAETRIFVAAGILGGFTTFSTLGWGTDLLLAGHEELGAAAYLIASAVGGIAAAAGGMHTGRSAANRGSNPRRKERAEMRAIESRDRTESAQREQQGRQDENASPIYTETR